MVKKFSLKLAISFWIVVTITYYFFYVAVDKWINNFCRNKYCLELLEYSDILSMYIAIIGLIFVVRGLDIWKEQLAYNEATNNLKELKKLYGLSERFQYYFHNITTLSSRYNSMIQADMEFNEKLIDLDIYNVLAQIEEPLKNSIKSPFKEELIEAYNLYSTFFYETLHDYNETDFENLSINESNLIVIGIYKKYRAKKHEASEKVKEIEKNLYQNCT